MSLDNSTEADAVAELARLASEPNQLEPGAVIGIALGDGQKFVIEDLEKFLPNPRRKISVVHLHEKNSLVRYTQAHGEPSQTALFANVDSGEIAAVLNGHVENADMAGWGDHVAVLALRHTDSWKLWSGKNETWMSQEQFAEHIEEGLIDILEPPSADMLEMAQTFHATNKVEFKSSTLLANGQRQLSYEETIASRAGQQGNMTIPTGFSLQIAVYEGQEESDRVEARLQHRIVGTDLKMRYLLTRPKDVIRVAFDGIVTAVEQGTALTAYRGSRR